MGATGLGVCSRHVRDELGMSYRQMDYAVRAGYLRPVREWRGRRRSSGSPRYWTDEELDVARRLGRLTAAGLALETAARVARSGPGRSEIAPGITIEVSA